MLKPQVWMSHGDWVGRFSLETEAEWKIWEDSYRAYILTFAQIADTTDVALFCIGTEYRIAAIERLDFWRRLIKEVRAVYKGKLTYAATSDNYHKIQFWDDLDYIGIDAYYDLLPNDTPTVKKLEKAWQPHKKKIQDFQTQIGKAVIFTEYGYMSVDGAAGKHWEKEEQMKQLAANETAQSNAYAALYNSFWEEEWFAGGFLWKWYHTPEQSERNIKKDYTPQTKAAHKTLKERYGN